MNSRRRTSKAERDSGAGAPRRREIRIQSYNPYAGLPHVPPVTRVVSRETLDLIKHLRAEGHRVVVLPEDGTPLHYTVEKGFRELLADPVLAFAVNIPVSVVVGLVTNWVYDRMKRRPQVTTAPENVGFVLEMDEAGTRVRYDAVGQPLSDERFRDLMATLEARADRWTAVRQTRSPRADLPFPVFVEHTQEIVGWCNLRMDETGLKVAPALITDEQTWLRIQIGDLKGFSFGGLVHDSRCGLCGRPYTECDHVAGEVYPEGEGAAEISGIHFAEISVVRDPVQPLATFTRSGPLVPQGTFHFAGNGRTAERGVRLASSVSVAEAAADQVVRVGGR